MMDDYTRKMMRIAVAQTCLSVGWSTIQTSPLEILTDLLSNYILGLCKRANNYAFLFNQTEPNLDHIALAFQDLGISIPELEEFVNYFEISNCPEIPQYPVRKDSNLNFLKPGSREVVTRPVHIHEHLPPMYPHLEEHENTPAKTGGASSPPPDIPSGTASNAAGDSPVVVSPGSGVLKRRSDNPTGESFAMRRARALAEEETHTLREISSVMMTTSGFLSHAREGKLPEVRTIPVVDSEPEEEAPPPPPPIPPPEVKPEPPPIPPPEVKPEKKKKKKSHGDSAKKDKEKSTKDEPANVLGLLLPSKSTSIHPIPPDDSQVKKLVTQKETSKLKVLKPGATKTIAVMPDSFPSTPKSEKKHKPKRPNSPGAAVSTQSPATQPKTKVPKMEKTLHKDRTVDESVSTDTYPDIKLTAEPDKQKLNIFKKISKVKEDHDDIKMEVDDIVPVKSVKEAPVSEPVKKLPAAPVSEIVKEDKETEVALDIESLHSPTAFGSVAFGDEIMPGTPTTPRTPDIPKIVTDSKKKNREKHKEKKEREKFNINTSPVSSRICDVDSGKPKTPEVIVDTVDDGLPPFPFLSYPTGPAVIPPNLASNPLIPQMNLIPFGPRLLPPPPVILPPPLKEILPPSITISPVIPQASTTSSPTVSTPSTPATPTTKKKDKKGKKNKDKIKKKKDKKEKIKSKEKSEKKKLKLQKKQKLQEKLKLKKEKKYKKKENQVQEEKRGDSPSVPKITFKLGPEPQREASPGPKITFKPLIRKEDDSHVEVSKKHSSDILTTPVSSVKHHKGSSSKSSKGTMNIGSHVDVRGHQKAADLMAGAAKAVSMSLQVPSKMSTHVKVETAETPESNQLWICPACGRPDDGSPMIACDACDMWYHYVCVGIQDAPESDWFCQGCISKRPDLVDKKKKHKKKK